MLDLSTQSYFLEPVLDDGKWQVSPAGGDEPVWSPDGRELFYREGTSTNLMAVPVGTEPSFTYETSQNLFSVSGCSFPGGGRKYDIAPNGQRFVFLKGGGAQTGEDAGPPQVIVVQNWHEELKRLVPVD